MPTGTPLPVCTLSSNGFNIINELGMIVASKDPELYCPDLAHAVNWFSIEDGQWWNGTYWWRLNGEWVAPVGFEDAVTDLVRSGVYPAIHQDFWQMVLTLLDQKWQINDRWVLPLFPDGNNAHLLMHAPIHETFYYLTPHYCKVAEIGDNIGMEVENNNQDDVSCITDDNYPGDYDEVSFSDFIVMFGPEFSEASTVIEEGTELNPIDLTDLSLATTEDLTLDS